MNYSKNLDNENIVSTIICKNYMAQAKTLIQSLMTNHGFISCHVLVVDLTDDEIDTFLNDCDFHIVRLKDLKILNFSSFVFKYNITELCTATKPYLLSFLFTTYGSQKIIYLDPDIYVYQSLGRIYEILDSNSIVLTPHLSFDSVPEDEYLIKDTFILVSGVYNLGFLGLANTPTTHRFLRWWQNKLYDQCIIDHRHGLFVDQKWVDLVPGMFDDVHILRESGYNVAYWNLHERSLRFDKDTWYCNDQLLYFFHYSGLSIQQLELVSRHQNRFNLVNSPELKPLFESYKQKLLENDYFNTSKLKYGYGYYSDGSIISDQERNYYYLLGSNKHIDFPNPFDVNKEKSFKKYLWKIKPLIIMKTKIFAWIPEKLILILKYWVRSSLQTKQ